MTLKKQATISRIPGAQLGPFVGEAVRLLQLPLVLGGWSRERAIRFPLRLNRRAKISLARD